MSITERSRAVHNGSCRDIYYESPTDFAEGGRSLVEHAKKKLLYNELAPLYDLAISRDTQREVNFLIDLIETFRPSSKSILDLGCGVGRHAGPLSNRHEVTGIDISGKMIRVARKRYPECEFHEMDMRNITLERSFDVAIRMSKN